MTDPQELSRRLRATGGRGQGGKTKAEAASLIDAQAARIAELEKALGPFVMTFEGRRDAYAHRYADRSIGIANFDKMPDAWSMDSLNLNMGDFRRARKALSHE